MKVVLSTALNGSKVRVLVNDDSLEPVTGEIVTLESPLDKGVVPLIQVTSISVMEISVSVALLIVIVHVSMRGVVLPANSGPEGTVTTTSGVETEK